MAFCLSALLLLFRLSLIFHCVGVASESSSIDQSKRLRTGGDYTHAGYAAPPFHPQPTPVWGNPG